MGGYLVYLRTAISVQRFKDTVFVIELLSGMYAELPEKRSARS